MLIPTVQTIFQNSSTQLRKLPFLASFPRKNRGYFTVECQLCDNEITMELFEWEWILLHCHSTVAKWLFQSWATVEQQFWHNKWSEWELSVLRDTVEWQWCVFSPHFWQWNDNVPDFPLISQWNDSWIWPLFHCHSTVAQVFNFSHWNDSGVFFIGWVQTGPAPNALPMHSHALPCTPHALPCTPMHSHA